MSISQPEGYWIQARAVGAPSVLVLHAWWGLNETIRDFCRRLAEAGFNAFAPDLYHGQVADTIPAAQALGQSLDEHYQQARAEIAAAADYLFQNGSQPGPGLAVIGFSLGAYYALDLSAARPDLVDTVVLFYGTGGGIDFSAARARYQGHFAETDPFEPLDGVQALEASLQAAGRPAAFHIYPGAGHWFFEPDRKDSYNPVAARLAWERTLDFLKKQEPDAAGRPAMS